MRPAMIHQRVHIQLVGFGHDEQTRHFAERGVPHADHRAVGDLRMPEDDFLDLGRRDVLAAADDQFLDASGDRQIAGRVRLREIAGVVPALAQRRRGFGRLVVIALHQVRPAHDQFALVAEAERLPATTDRRCARQGPAPAVRTIPSAARHSASSS